MKSGEWRSLHAAIKLRWERPKTSDAKAGDAQPEHDERQDQQIQPYAEEKGGSVPRGIA